MTTGRNKLDESGTRRQADFHRMKTAGSDTTRHKRLWVIGDIHGMYDPLRMLVNQIRYVKYETGEDAKLIFLGDYIDRGPSSREVIDLIIGLEEEFETVCLAGNHEDMMLQFLNGSDLVEELGNAWFEGNGGQQTVCSFTASPAVYRKLFASRDRRVKFRPEDFDLAPKYRHFFENLAYAHTETLEYEGRRATFAFTHAGLFDRSNQPVYFAAGLPDITPEEQLALTNFASFHAFRRKWKIWLEHLHLWNRDIPRDKHSEFILVHGHTPTPALAGKAEHVGDFDPASCLPFVKFTSNGVCGDRIGNTLVFNADVNDIISVNIDTGSAYGKALTAISLHPKDFLDNHVIDVLQARIDLLDRVAGQAIGFSMSFEPDHPTPG